MAKAKKAPAKKAKKAPTKKAATDPRLKHYRPEKGRKDAVLLDAIGEGNLDEVLGAERDEVGDDGILYISDRIRYEGAPAPDKRRVTREHLIRYLERRGFRLTGCHQDVEDNRIYATAEPCDS